MGLRRVKVDANQSAIVRALRAVGATVVDLSAVGGGLGDLLVGYHQRTHLLEVKNPATSYGRKGFSQSQTKFNAAWRGAPPVVVYTVEEALQAIGATIGGT